MPVIDGRMPYIISDVGGMVVCIICCVFLFMRMVKTRAGIKFRYFLVIVQLDAKVPFNIFIYNSVHVSSMCTVQ